MFRIKRSLGKSPVRFHMVPSCISSPETTLLLVTRAAREDVRSNEVVELNPIPMSIYTRYVTASRCVELSFLRC